MSLSQFLETFDQFFVNVNFLFQGDLISSVELVDFLLVVAYFKSKIADFLLCGFKLLLFFSDDFDHAILVV